jgi:PAS domain S-box-containing protein
LKIDKNSLVFRLLIPILLTIVVITGAMALVGGRLIHDIVDDYHHFVASNHAEETRRLYDAALAEMTTARLLDNPAVVEAKKEVLVEATGLDWQRREVGGIIVDRNGSILLTTFPPALTSNLISHFDQGFIDLHEASGVYFGQVVPFHPWGWRIITVAETRRHELADEKVKLLLPLLVLGPLLMLGAVLIILRRMRGPMDMLVTAVAKEEAVAPTGVTELDTFGSAYNLSLGRIKERTAALARELAERKAAEELIRRKEARIRLLLQSASEGIYGVDLEGKCTFCNPSCCSLLGYREEELLGRNIHALIHHAHADGAVYPEEECRIYHAFRAVRETHEEREVFWRADGTPFPVEYWAHPVIEDGKTVGAVVTFFDVTARMESEKQLRQAWQDWQTTFDSTTDLIILLSPDGTIRQANKAFARFCGREINDLVGQTCFSIVHGTTDHIDNCPLVRARQSLHREEMELSAGGKTFNVVVDPVFSADGKFNGAVHTMHDITERKLMEEELRAEKNKSEAIVAGLGDGISIQDLDYTILYQNQVHQNFVGPHVGESCFKAYQNKDEVCQGCPVALSFVDGQIHSVERRLERPDGSHFFEIKSSPLRDGSGTIVGGIELVRDVTERKRAEEQLFHAQKMEGIGHLAGGVAHDFNNVLNVIQGYSDLLRLKKPDEKSLNKYLDHIVAAVQRGATITRQILSFSRKGAIAVQSVNLNELIAALQNMLRRLVREDIEIQVNLSPEKLVIAADPGLLDQILINLATNASDAMPDGGRLRIETAQVALDEEFIKLHGYGTPGNYALLTVSDNGTGMPEAVRMRIFEPFYTTKVVGKGTGLGLAMVYGIVRKHDGHINVYSEVGHGTVFRIYLPMAASDQEHQGDLGVAEGEVLPGGTETILVAEDDPSLREWAQTMLTMRGYQVIEAVDGSDAVQKFAGLKDGIDLVLLDGIMPNLNGRQALVEMRSLQPGLKAIILSGYAEDVFTQDDLQTMQVTFVQKPVVPNELLRTIRQVLDA